MSKVFARKKKFPAWGWEKGPFSGYELACYTFYLILNLIRANKNTQNMKKTFIPRT